MRLVHTTVSYQDDNVSSMKLKKRRFPSNDSFTTSSTSRMMTSMMRILQRHHHHRRRRRRRRRHNDTVILFLAIWIISISLFDITTFTTAWQILTLPPRPPIGLPSLLLVHRRYDSSCNFRNLIHRFRYYGRDITTATKTTTTIRLASSSSSSSNVNDSFDMDETDVAMMTITTTTTTTTTNHDSTDTDTTTATSTNTNNTNNSNSNMIPANLRRKIQAKRPTLGHVVPYQYKIAQQQQQQSSSSSSSSSSGGSLPSQLRLQGRRGNINTANTINPNPNQNKHTNYLIQIMAGMARGRKLESPSTVYLRPMMGKVKEAIYSTLTSFGIYNQNTNIPIRHLDIFAGSGSVGLESLSRGATHCTFVDFSMDCCQCIQRNIDLTGLGTTTTTTTNHPNNYNTKDTTTTPKSTLVCCADAMTALINPTSIGIPSNIMPYQIITICPPYEEVIYGDLLEAVVGSDTVTEDTIVIVEYPIELLQPPRRSNKNYKKDNNDTSSLSLSLSHPNNPTTNQNIYYGMPHVIQSKTNTAIGIRNRKYGRTVMAFYIINPTGRYPDANSRPEEFVQPV